MDERERQERQAERDRTTKGWLFGFIGGVVVLALMAITYVIGFNVGEDRGREAAGPAQPTATAPAPGQPTATETEPAPPSGPGLDLFAQSCGSCHTLSAADTTGTVGPNLDDLAPDKARVLAAIKNGGAGSGIMPANLLQGKEAEQVAEFVAANAGG